jgi:hypothetical protein
MYKIFLDKNKVFECNIKIEGASLDDSEARLLLESENFTLTFKGKINLDGTVKIPINKLKGVLKENYTGKITLEVIAEDTVFKPWEGEYQTDVSKKVEVKFGDDLSESVKEPVVVEEKKPKVTFSIVPDEFDTKNHIKEIFKILESHKVNRKNLVENKKVFNKLVETYCSLNYINNPDNVLSIKKDLIKNIK